MKACTACGQHVLDDPCVCPHCGDQLRSCGRSRVAHTAAAAMMGLALAGCGEKDGDSVTPQPDYGVFDSSIYEDEDGDGVSLSDGDCDDDNADIYPGAEETAGDGVDSNCDGADDT